MAIDAKTREILNNLKNAILNYDTEGAKKAAKNIVDKGIDPNVAINEGVMSASTTLHEKFERGECFIPHLVMAGDAMEAAGQILESAIPKEQIASKKVVVIGTVEADLHSVGKNIVAMFFRSGGFEVHDMGVNVKASSFISKAVDTNADIIALSSLLTTTRPYMREVIEEMESVGVRDKFKVIVGGGPITLEWAQEIGADGYGTDAYEGIEVAKKLLGISAS